MTLVSVLISTYHRPEFIGGAIETALKQTHEPIEIIVVNDDASDQETRSAIDKYYYDNRVQIIHNKKRTGISASRNQAAAEANGEYLCILDDDDRWVADKVERQIKLFESLPSDYGVVYTGGQVWSSPTRKRIVNRFTPLNSRRGNIWPDILSGWKMDPHSSHMIRKNAFESVSGFDESFDHGEDWDLSIRLAREYRFEAIEDPLTIQFAHESNVSHRLRHVKQNQQILMKYFDEIFACDTVQRKFFSEWHHLRGFRELQSGNQSNAVRYSWLSIGYNLTLEGIFLFILSLFGPRIFYQAQKLRQFIRTKRYMGKPSLLDNN